LKQTIKFRERILKTEKDAVFEKEMFDPRIGFSPSGPEF